MRKTFIIGILIAFVFISHAQKEKICGSWLMVKAEVDGSIEEPYFITDFKENGEMVIMLMEAGTWKYNKKNHSMDCISDLDKDFNGESKILTLTDDEMIVTKDGATLSYIKIDRDKIAADNEEAKLEGTWKIQDNENPDNLRLLKFELPDSYSFVETGGGRTSNSSGAWMFNPKDETLTMLGFTRLFRGKNTILSIDADKFEMVHKGVSIKAVKEVNDPASIERLSFEYDDFIDEDTDEYISSDEYNLPWVYFEEMVNFLQNVEYVKYKEGQLLEAVNTIGYTVEMVSIIDVDVEDYRVKFTNLWLEYGDSTQYSQDVKGGLMEAYNDFFPEEELSPYRITGIETITIEAGTFECTVIEGLDGEAKMKYWMINDKPGIYAKIISEDLDPFDVLEYNVIELVEIK